MSEDTQNISNETKVNEFQFKKTTCDPWCPSQHCPICSNFNNVSNNDVISCGHDNKATQMGFENACTRFDPNSNSKNEKIGVACSCKEERCYCYCIIRNCVCSFGKSLEFTKLTELLIVIVTLSFFVS